MSIPRQVVLSLSALLLFQLSTTVHAQQWTGETNNVSDESDVKVLEAVDVDTMSAQGATAEDSQSEAKEPHRTNWAFGLGLGVALQLDAFVTQGRTFQVDVSEGKSDGVHGINYAPSLELSYCPPIPEPWRILSVVSSVGYTPFFGSGLASYQQYESNNGSFEQVTSVYQYDWSVHVIPVDIGLRLVLPLDLVDLELPLRIEGEAGFSGGFAFASSKLTRDNQSEPFSQDVGDSDFGLGYHLGVGVAWPLSMAFGSVVASYRYSAVRLDFHRPDFNATWGDLGGHHLVLGYRLEL